jgi:hypothetical protein
VIRLRAPLRLFLPLALFALGAGCGVERDATVKQIDELRAEVARLRANQAALAERLDTVDIERGAFAKGAAAAESGPASTANRALMTGETPKPPSQPADHDRPELDVVRLSPSEGDGDADSRAPRPLIRAVGDGTGTRQTLNNKTIGARPAPKKGVVASTPKQGMTASTPKNAADNAPSVAKQ